MSMKKLLCILLTLAALLALAACGAGNDGATATEPAAETKAAAKKAVSETETEPEPAADGAYKAAFAEVVDSFEQKYGNWVSKEKESYVDGYGKGVLFCDLFDWDQDGDPELFVGYNELNDDQLLLTDLEVFTYENGAARRILHGKPGRDYMVTSSFQDFRFVRDGNGSIVLILPHAKNIWDNETLTQYWYRDGKVTSVQLEAQAENYDKDSMDPPELNAFRIDGETVDKAQYDEAKLEKEDDTLYIVCNRVDFTALKTFLQGGADSFRSAFLTSKDLHSDDPKAAPDDIVPAWVADVVSEY